MKMSASAMGASCGGIARAPWNLLVVASLLCAGCGTSSSPGPTDASTGSDAQTGRDGSASPDSGPHDGSMPADAPPAPDGGPTDAAAPDGAAPARTLHFAANPGDMLAPVRALGFDLIDLAGSTSNPSDTRTRVDALPDGVYALVWVGNIDRHDCTTPDFTEAQFEAQIDALAGDPKVFGYYIADEPHPILCPNAPMELRTRADYLHAHAPGQMGFITIVDGTNQCSGTLGCEYAALRPEVTHIDLFGLDPYPCHYDTSGAPVACDFSEVGGRVTAAETAGIPASKIVPVFQVFGQMGRTGGGSVYYRMPSVAELTQLLDTWAGIIPSPAFDYVYTYGVQCTTSSCPSPQALANHPELDSVVMAHNL